MTEQEKSYSQMRKDFYEKYKTKIVPIVQKYEKERKKNLLLAIIASTISVVLGSLLLYVAYANGKFNEDVAYFVILFYSLSYLSWYWIKKSFENTIKRKIMPTVCHCFGDMKWSHGYYSGGNVFLQSGVIPKFTSKDYDDIFKGSFKDVYIEIIEAKYQIGSGRSRRTVFNGVIVKLDMNKSFTSHTVIKTKRLMQLSPISELHYTELEDVEFNKKYDIFTNDEIDARYLITPTFMERLKKMKVAFRAKNVSCAFWGNFLIVALPTNKDVFSLCSLVKSIDNAKPYFQMYEEIESIIKLIDHFKLNQKISI